MAAQDIELNVVTRGVDSLKDVSIALRTLTLAMNQNIRVASSLDARQRGLDQALGMTSRGMGEHAKTLRAAISNQSTLSQAIKETTSDLARLQKELARGRGGPGMGKLVKDLEISNKNLKGIKAKALVSDLRSVSTQIKRLGKDAQFVGRSLIIGLTTPIVAFASQGLQAMYSLEKQVVRLNKLLGESAKMTLTDEEVQGFAKLGIQVSDTTVRMDALTKTMKSVSMELGISRDILTAITGDFAELGVNSSDVLAGLTKIAAEVSVLGTMDLSASQELSQTLFLGIQRALDKRGELFASAAEKQARAAELVRSQVYLYNAIENATAMSFRDIATALPEVAAAATSFGLTFVEGIALVAPIKAAGIDVSVGTNAIKMSLQRLTAPTIVARKHMKNLRNEFKAMTPVVEQAFDGIFGVGTGGIQSLIDITSAMQGVENSTAETLAMFSKLFDKRQSTRMQIAIEDLVAFQNEMNRAGSQTNSLINSVNEFTQAAAATTGGTVPLINNYKTLADVSKLAGASLLEGQKSLIIGGKEYFQEDIDAARAARRELRQFMKDEFDKGRNVIEDITQESGKVMFTQLAGASSAMDLANKELEIAKNSISVTVDRIKISFKELSLQFINEIKPILETVADAFKKLIDTLENMDPAIKKAFIVFTAFVASIGPAVFIFGQIKLAFGTVFGGLLKFVPGLKNLSIEAVGSNKGLLRLKNGLSLSGDAVINNNSKFATFIGTLAGGSGPVGRLASKFGELTGILRKVDTASIGVQEKLKETSRVADTAFRGMAADPGDAIQKRLDTRAQFDSAALATKRAATQAAREQELNKARIAAGIRASEARAAQSFVRTPTGGFVKRGRGGKFKALTPRQLFVAQSLERIKQDQQTSRLESLTKRASQRRQLLAKTSYMEDAGIDVDTTTREGKFKFRGKDITEAEANRIALAGGKRRARAGLIASRTAGRVKAVGAGVKSGVMGAGAAAVDLYKDPLGTAKKGAIATGKGIAAGPMKAYGLAASKASKHVAELTAKNAAFGLAAPGHFAKATAIVKGFNAQLALGPRLLKLIKAAFIGIGIGAVIIGATALIIIFIKNFDKIKSSAKPVIDALKGAFETLKDIMGAIITPFKDFFAILVGGKEGATSTTDGIASGMQKVAEFITMASQKVQQFVNTYVVPFLRLALGALLNFINGIKGMIKALIAMKDGGVVAFEQFKQSAGVALNGIIQFAAGVLAPALATVFAEIAKIGIKLFFMLVKQIPNILGIAVKIFLEFRILVMKVFVFLLTGALKILANLPAGIGKIMDKVVDLFAQLVEKVTGFLRKIPFVGDAIDGAISGIRGLGTVLETVGQAASDGLNWAVDGIAAGLDGIVNLVDSAGGAVGNAAMDLGRVLSDKLGDALEGGPDAANAFIDNIAASVKDYLARFKPDGIGKAAEGFWNDFRDESEDPLDEIAENVEDIITDAGGQAGENAAEEFAKKLEQTLKDLKQRFVNIVLDVFQTSIQDALSGLVEALNKQKEAALQVYEDQLDTIAKLQQAEESLMREREYIADRKRMLDERELQRQNYIRNRALAIYEGRIDDARLLDLEERKSKIDSASELVGLDEKRNRQLAEENLDFVKDQIKKTKKETEKFFREQIEAFQEAARQITRFAPNTIEEYEEQLNALTDLARETANKNGDAFAETFAKMTTAIQTQLPNIGAGVFSTNLQELVNVARQKYGLESPNENTIVGATIAMLGAVSQSVQTDGLQINQSMDTLIQDMKNNVVDKGLTEINKIFEEKNPHKVLEEAIETANETIRREFEKTVGHVASKVDDLANSIDPFILKIAEAQLALESLRDAAAQPMPTPQVPGSTGGGGGAARGPGPTQEGNRVPWELFPDWTVGMTPPSSSTPTPPKPAPSTPQQPFGARSLEISKKLYSIFANVNPNSLANNIADEKNYKTPYQRNNFIVPFVNLWNSLKSTLSPNILMELNNANFEKWKGSELLKNRQMKPYIDSVAEEFQLIRRAALSTTGTYTRGFRMGSGGAGGGSGGSFAYGGYVNAFKSQGVNALLHGGEYVINSRAVSNIGLAALKSLNDMRFSTPGRYSSSPAQNNITETHNYNIYVDNFIGEDQWFESMMKSYNMKVVPKNQKNAGLQSRSVSTYSGINRGM